MSTKSVGPMRTSSSEPEAPPSTLVHYRHGERQGRCADLADKVGAATKAAHGVLGGTLEGIVFAGELPAVNKNPPTRAMSFQISAHCLVGCDFGVEIRALHGQQSSRA